LADVIIQEMIKFDIGTKVWLFLIFAVA
jgi:hypothetical protein